MHKTADLLPKLNGESMDSYNKLMNKMESLHLAPRTKSNIEIEILKQLYKPEEAEIACHINDVPEPVAIIADRACMDAEALMLALETMVEKRIIFKVYTETPLFCLPAFHSVKAYQVGLLSPENALRWQRYWEEGLAEDLCTNKTPAIRVVPVSKSIAAETTIFSYEEAEQLIRDAKTTALADCICRSAEKLVGKGCGAPVKDICILLDARGEFYAQTKIGRFVSKEEALEALARGREAGLVRTTANVQKGSSLICHCCGCCCTMLRAINELSIPTAVTNSNFIAGVDAEKCTGCGACVDRCHVRALEMVDNVGHIKEERCIGCGVCEDSCVFDAISLRRKSVIVPPPADVSEFKVRHAAGRPRG